MIIDLPTYNLLVSDCCPCAALPSCPPNTILCESYSVGDCGFNFFYMDATSATPLSESCKIYTRKRFDYTASEHTSQPTTIGAASGTNTHDLERSQFAEYKQIWAGPLSARICSDEVTTQFNSDGTDATKFTNGDIFESSHDVYESSSSPGNPCNGTDTFTYNNGTTSNTTVFEFDTCYLLDWEPNDAWTFVAPSTFTLDSSPAVSEGTTGTRHYTYKIEFSEQLTAEILTNELNTQVNGLTAWPGEACDSYVAASSVYEPLTGTPPLSASFLPPVCTQVFLVNKTRYKMGVPDSYQEYRRAKDTYDACILAATTPEQIEACGLNPQLSSYDVHKYFAIQWDTVFFPTTWDAWNDYYLNYQSQLNAHAKWVEDYAIWQEDHTEWVTEHAKWQTAHDAWKDSDEYRAWEIYNNATNAWYECINGGGSDCGEQPAFVPYPPNEPQEPQEPIAPIEPIVNHDDDPGPEPTPKPEFVDENLFWTWTGTIEGSIDSFYEPTFHEIPVPLTPGSTRIVNKQVKCFRAASGSPPTFVGETYNPDDYNPS